jgi:hypothetical protein
MNDLRKATERGTKAWADVPDASEWVEELRGNVDNVDMSEAKTDKSIYAAPYTKLDTTAGVLHKEWVGLTIDEIDKFVPYVHSDHDLSEFRTFAFEIEAKLKEKNR